MENLKNFVISHYGFNFSTFSNLLHIKYFGFVHVKSECKIFIASKSRGEIPGNVKTITQLW